MNRLSRKNYQRILRMLLSIITLFTLSRCGDDDNESINRSPEVNIPLSDWELTSGFGSQSIDLSNTFSDADNDVLEFTAEASAPGVVTVSISGTVLTLSEVDIGSSTITVSASDGNGGMISDEFLVMVIEEVVSVTCESVFTIALDIDGCTVNIESQLNTTSQYTETVSGNTRSVTINSIPSHLVGVFPNPGNPNEISEQGDSFMMTTQPTLANNSTTGQGYVNAVLFSGVGVEVFTGEYFIGSGGETNRDWNINALQLLNDLGLDCNNAHVQPTGQYHYHGVPNAYGSDLTADGTEMIKVGYAADGFPLYYLYYEDANGNIVKAEASYELRSGDRGGDDVSAPSGCYDGEYFADYEFVSGSGDLDLCNGRTGPTPEAPNGEYYYVITEDFPSAPICFSGTPASSFRLGMGG